MITRALMLVATVAAIGCGKERNESAQATKDERSTETAPANSYVPPATGVKTLITELAASRDPHGGIILAGQAALPHGTKIGLDLSRKGRKGLLGQAHVYIDDSGHFRSEPFSDNGKPHVGGEYLIDVYAHFNAMWQPSRVLSLVGDEGAKLPASALIPNDLEFPEEAGRHLEEQRAITIPSHVVGDDEKAIAAVKAARLVVEGQGKSADPVIGVVQLFAQAPGFVPGSWHAERSADGAWVVTLHCMDGKSPSEAKWKFDPRTKHVEYLNHLAKQLSWSPKD